MSGLRKHGISHHTLSVLARATIDGKTEARATLDEMCRRYWRHLNDFIRGHGYSPADADDLMQQGFCSTGWNLPRSKNRIGSEVNR